jgi:hypothetical protein
VIGKFDEVISLVQDLCAGTITWEEGMKRLPRYTGEQEV